MENNILHSPVLCKPEAHAGKVERILWCLQFTCGVSPDTVVVSTCTVLCIAKDVYLRERERGSEVAGERREMNKSKACRRLNRTYTVYRKDTTVYFVMPCPAAY